MNLKDAVVAGFEDIYNHIHAKFCKIFAMHNRGPATYIYIPTGTSNITLHSLGFPRNAEDGAVIPSQRKSPMSNINMLVDEQRGLGSTG